GAEDTGESARGAYRSADRSLDRHAIAEVDALQWVAGEPRHERAAMEYSSSDEPLVGLEAERRSDRRQAPRARDPRDPSLLVQDEYQRAGGAPGAGAAADE